MLREWKHLGWRMPHVTIYKHVNKQWIVLGNKCMPACNPENSCKTNHCVDNDHLEHSDNKLRRANYIFHLRKNPGAKMKNMNIYMGVSKNRGTPKSSILIGFSIINHPFWGTIIFGNTHIKSELLQKKSHLRVSSKLPNLEPHSSGVIFWDVGALFAFLKKNYVFPQFVPATFALDFHDSNQWIGKWKFMDNPTACHG